MTDDPDSVLLTSIGEHYVVDRVIGRGGMATVYLCRDTRDESLVAVKVLRKELGSALIVERFLREIAFASELDHPRIPKVLSSGVIGDLPYYAMTYIDGESLKKKIEREKQLGLDDAIHIACEVISPTAYAHSRGIVHRDIKPDNILIAADGVYVLDFGIARAIIESGVDRLTSTGIGVGTPAYMSPEQALGDRNLDARSDVYSLGCVVYEMIAGIPPFVGPTSQAIISRRFAASPPPLSEVRDSVPEEIEDAVQRALARSPADRWPTAAAFGKALEACSTDTPTGASRRAKASYRRRLVQRIAVAAGIVAVVAAGVIAWTRGQRSSFDKAQDALQSWDLDTAEGHFGQAVAANPDDAASHLWLAQTKMLQGKPTAQWKPNLVTVADHRADLQDVDRIRADALSALAAENFAEACPRFGNLVSAQNANRVDDFTSRLALGDCLGSDNGVLPDSASVSGFRFRTSHQAVDSIYQSLLERNSDSAPAFAAILPRLEHVLPINKAAIRRGAMGKSKPVRFTATPSLIGDTLAYIPYPPAGTWRKRDEAGFDAIVSRNRQRLRALSLTWTQLAPKASDAHAFHARILGATGELDGESGSALREIRIARRLAQTGSNDPEQEYLDRLRLQRDEVEFLLRLGRYAEAGRIADSALSVPVPPSFSDAAADEVLDARSSLAAIRGRTATVISLKQQFAARELVRLPNGDVVTLPPVLGRDYLALLGFATFGGPADSIRAAISRLSENMEATVPASQLAGMRVAVLQRSLLLATPTIGPQMLASLPRSPELFVSTFQTFGTGDVQRTRILLDSISRLRADFAPGEITIDAVYLEAWLRTALLDSTGAARALDNGLRGLETALPRFFKDDIQAASLVRAMMLRAELARSANPVVAKRWSDAAFDLWGSGDPPIAEAVQRLRSRM